ncbi:hypothetical protein [Pseudomonas sp. ICMP 460]|uniref:hypothetical protein n=1 Tax=Pseudomonas sp. ICMP 460 TaxID=1718917 RepID=UPI000C06C0D4|nr:hypothetical protein [Pseudomonas sp. ICMP 460]PHN29649.1 hypothetical protein AO240_24820 [Pseudomonas sp. ICMP 460]
MRKFWRVLAALLFAISILGALLWMGGVAGAVTGGGRNTNDIEFLLTAAKVLFILSLISAALAFFWPKKAKL